ncbi:MAG: YjbH domain-containing protein [Formivibrio sp.]|nr:YjbH domain-containing protein [Formivibrio sp.]
MALAATFLTSVAAYGADTYSDGGRNSFGEVGLLEMPSAHVAPDGSFGFNVGDTGNYQRFAVFFQALPWLDTSFRYSRAAWWEGYNVFYDRSFGAKARLLNEKDDFADVSIGLRDVLGTGVYGSEYVVASKHVGPVDITAGLGWGRLASTGTLPNPIGVIIPSFNTRGQAFNTGQFDLKNFFRGPKTGVFGGLQWDTPLEGLRLVAEYSSDRYVTEGAFPRGLKVRSPVNLGVSYGLDSNFQIKGGWLYGSTYGAVITVTSDANSAIPSALRIGPPVPTAVSRTDEQRQASLEALRQGEVQHVWRKSTEPWVDTSANLGSLELTQALMSEGRGVRGAEVEGTSIVINARMTGQPDQQCSTYAEIVRVKNARITTVAVSDLENPKGVATVCSVNSPKIALLTDGRLDSSATKLLEDTLKIDLNAQSMLFSGMTIKPAEIWLYYENYRYLSQAEAAGRVTRILMKDAPASIEIFHLIPANLGVPSQMITVTRSSMERHIASAQSGSAIGIAPAPMHNPALYSSDVSGNYPVLTYSLSPKLTQRLFDPDDPIEFMLYGDAEALLRLAPGLNIEVEGTGTIWTNYSFARLSDSLLPHVRSDTLEYTNHGKYGISGLDINYRGRLKPNVFFEVRGGLLEDMFAGVGGQLLWRPQNSRFAFGADVWEVWQREFHRLFALQNYKVFTGHVTAYYASPWYNLNFAVHVGQYLAGDRGATLEITRRFAGGIQIGGWATFTNVSASRFGEGSFDKGIIIHIPLQWGLPIFSQSFYDMHLSSLTRDGGQRLGGDDGLYDATLDTSVGDLKGHLDEIADP